MGANVTGYELSPIPYLISFLRLKATGKSFKLKFKNFLKDDLSEAEIVYLFFMPRTIENFKNKLPKAAIISYAFPIPDLESKYKIKHPKRPSIYIYRR
ncbi:MAG: hypothetical protein WC519_02935 [Parcubacteria group bacterium]